MKTYIIEFEKYMVRFYTIVEEGMRLQKVLGPLTMGVVFIPKKSIVVPLCKCQNLWFVLLNDVAIIEWGNRMETTNEFEAFTIPKYHVMVYGRMKLKYLEALLTKVRN